MMTHTGTAMLAVGVDARTCLPAPDIVQSAKTDRQPRNPLGNPTHYIAHVVKAKIDAAKGDQRDHENRGSDGDVRGIALPGVYQSIDGQQPVKHGRGHRVAAWETVGREAENRIVEHGTATLDEMLQAEVEKVSAQYHGQQDSDLGVPAPVQEHDAAGDGDDRQGRRSAEETDRRHGIRTNRRRANVQPGPGVSIERRQRRAQGDRKSDDKKHARRYRKHDQGRAGAELARVWSRMKIVHGRSGRGSATMTLPMMSHYSLMVMVPAWSLGRTRRYNY